MADGWAKLGDMLAGTSDAKRMEIELKTQQRLAQRDSSVANAWLKLDKARQTGKLGESFAEIGMPNPDAYANAQRAGVNVNSMAGAMGNIQKMEARKAAVAAAQAGNFGEANANLFGVASGPQALPQVAGGVVIPNRFEEPGIGDLITTPQGASVIAANEARARASDASAGLSNAREQWGPSGGRTAAGGLKPQKLSEVQKLRMKSELADITARKKVALDLIADNEGARNPQSEQTLVRARAELKKIQEEEAGVFDKYERTAGAGSQMAPDEVRGPMGQTHDVNGVPVPKGWKPDQFAELADIALDRRQSGLPRLTGEQADAFQRTGTMSEGMGDRAAPRKVPAGVPRETDPGAISKVQSGAGLLEQAKAAIQRGASPEAVRKRLMERGYPEIAGQI
jgi:hypothetical protein